MSRPAVIGIDLGGTNCRGAVVDDEGCLFFEQTMKTAIDRGFRDFWTRLVHFCQDLVHAGRAHGYEVKGLGLGFPGVIGEDGTVRAAPNLAPLDGFPLGEHLTSALGFPVRVLNDANAIALGEGQRGAGRGFDHFLMITLGTGVGGGLVLNRRLWLGADGAAGEVGHVVVDPEGPPCGCGGRGCLEQYASGTALVRICREHWPANGAPAPQSAEAVAAAALRGDAAALQTFEIAGRALGQVLAGIANLLNLDGVVIGGGVSRNLALLLPWLQAEISDRTFAVSARRLQVVAAQLGDRAGILGAAQVVPDTAETQKPFLSRENSP